MRGCASPIAAAGIHLATLWDWETPEIDTFKGWVHNCMLRMAALSTQETNLGNVDIEYVAGAWANINQHGSYNDPARASRM